MLQVLYVANSRNITSASVLMGSPSITPSTTPTQSGTPQASAALVASLGANGPNGLAFDASGQLYAAVQNTHSVVKVFPNGTVATFLPSGSIGTVPYMLAFNRTGDGSLFISDPG